MFLVVFRNRKRAGLDQAAYNADAAHMERLAREQPGFLSFKSYCGDDGEVVAISEWQDEAAALAWAENAEHRAVQKRGQEHYYETYTLFACGDARVHTFDRSTV